ncbi:hypothetical protein [uncultured Gammaproteobacteria bacterium]|nr:hypothetical protein [uncultured Gammaproteobacteria bacterium]
MKQIDLLEMITKHYYGSIAKFIDAVSFLVSAMGFLIKSVVLLVVSLAIFIFTISMYIDKNSIIETIKIFSNS